MYIDSDFSGKVSKRNNESKQILNENTPLKYVGQNYRSKTTDKNIPSIGVF